MLVQIRQRHVRFHRHMLRRRRAERVFEYSVSLGKSLVHVAGAQFELITDVRLLAGFNVREIGESLRRPVLLMDERRSRLCRFEHVVHCGQYLIIDLDELKCVFRRAPIDRRHGNHGIADKADSFHSEDRLIAKRWPEVRIDSRHLRDLCTRQYNGHASQRFSLGFLDARNPRVRIRAAQNGHMQHAGHFNVTDMERPPRDFRIGVGSIDRLPDDGIVSHHNTVRFHCSLITRFSRFGKN